MRELTDRVLNLAQVLGATYANVRIVQRETQEITVKNGVVQQVSLDSTQGMGVRVVADGAWGFASSHELSLGEVDRVTALAVAIARARRALKKPGLEAGCNSPGKATSGRL